jgi:M6 family metalloprotease-like protein
MKKKILILVISLFSSLLLAQQDQMFVCGMGDTSFYRSPEDRGGLYTPSEGNLKAIVVFIQFKDDDFESSGWPLNTFPVWARDMMDAEPGEPFLRTNLSHYFHEMSNGIFEIYGYVHPAVMVTYEDEEDYGWNGLKYVNQEILTRLDPYINYSDYDNFTGSNPGPDTKVDMIFLIYRRFGDAIIGYSPGQGWTGYANLLLPYDLIFDGVTIKTGFPGSGIQQRGGYNGEHYTMYQAAHEFCHHEFGSGHIPGNSNLSIMNGGPAWNASRGMHPWEREKLDWIDYQDKSRNDIIYVTDFYTTDDVYRIPFSTTEYFLIVNHQDISPHDWARDKGIYIHHVTNADYFPPSINVECADGNWEFTVDTQNQKVLRGRSNKTTNEDELNFFEGINGVGYFCRTPFYPADDAWGDSYDAFDLIFNNVFSPKSNPYSANGGSLNFTVEALQLLLGNTYKLQLYFTDPYAGRPSKPQNLEVEPSANLHPYLTWDANQEPDVISGGNYRIEKYSTYEVGWFTLNTTSNTYYEDLTETICPPGQQCQTGHLVRYRVRVVDNTQKVSVPSDSVMQMVLGGYPDKINVDPVSSEKPTEYSLMQNYPNPFNPTTTISYSMPKNGLVILQVYDILGRAVAELVNEFKEAGNYSVAFNASELPSGIYFYTLKSGNFTATKKFILLK